VPRKLVLKYAQGHGAENLKRLVQNTAHESAELVLLILVLPMKTSGETVIAVFGRLEILK
jgi:hypothetical protein